MIARARDIRAPIGEYHTVRLSHLLPWFSEHLLQLVDVLDVTDKLYAGLHAGEVFKLGRLVASLSVFSISFWPAAGSNLMV